MDKQIYLAKEVAEILGITVSSVYNMVKIGRLKAVHIGAGQREMRITRQALEEFLEGGDNIGENTNSGITD